VHLEGPTGCQEGWALRRTSTTAYKALAGEGACPACAGGVAVLVVGYAELADYSSVGRGDLRLVIRDGPERVAGFSRIL